MRICVYGAGAIGGHLAAKLAAAGNEVSVVARGANLEALRTNGVLLRHGEREIRGAVKASEAPAELGKQDCVIVTLKANGLAALAGNLQPLLKAGTAVVFAQNGIPWWYALGLSKDRPAAPDLSRLDPGGKLLASVGAQRVLGAVIFSANTLVAPGVVQNVTPGRNMLVVGAPDDRASLQVAALRKAFTASDIHSPECSDIRQAVWGKLVLNISTATLCMLSGGGVADVRREPALVALGKTIAAEGLAIALAHGVDPAGAPQRPGGGHSSGQVDHKPSLIQDYEAGRPMEVEAQLAAPLAFARAAGVETPILDALVALVSYRAAAKGLYSI